MSGLFEHLAATEDFSRASGRKAVALARARTEKRFAKFVNAARDADDRAARLALVAGDMQETVKQACADMEHDDWQGVLATVQEHFGTTIHEARRPKMCPYHREVTDISLAVGDPQAGFSSMGQHAYGENSCRGTYDGRCNFKPEMVTQTYWDKKAEEREEKRQLREQLPVENATPAADLSVNNEEEAQNVMPNVMTEDVADGLAMADDPPMISEPAMAMASSRKAATVQNPKIHGTSLHPVSMIAQHKPGLTINGQDFHTWAAATPFWSRDPIEVQHPDPYWERIAARCLADGHGKALDEHFSQPRTAEALKTIDVDKDGVGPVPEMDKREWTPENVKFLDVEMDGSPHPTRHQDIFEPADYDADFLEQTDAVTDKQYVTDGIEERPQKHHSWPSGGDRSAVSAVGPQPGTSQVPLTPELSRALEICHGAGFAVLGPDGTPIGAFNEDAAVGAQNVPSADIVEQQRGMTGFSAVDPDKNPIREAILDMPSEDEAQRAISEFNGSN